MAERRYATVDGSLPEWYGELPRISGTMDDDDVEYAMIASDPMVNGYRLSKRYGDGVKNDEIFFNDGTGPKVVSRSMSMIETSPYDVGAFLDLPSMRDDERRRADEDEEEYFMWEAENRDRNMSWKRPDNDWAESTDHGRKSGGRFQYVKFDDPMWDKVDDILLGYNKDGEESEDSDIPLAAYLTPFGIGNAIFAGKTVYDVASGNRIPGLIDFVWGGPAIKTAVKDAGKIGRLARSRVKPAVKPKPKSIGYSEPKFGNVYDVDGELMDYAKTAKKNASRRNVPGRYEGRDVVDADYTFGSGL